MMNLKNFIFNFILKYSLFTVFCQFLLYSKMSHIYINCGYIYIYIYNDGKYEKKNVYIYIHTHSVHIYIYIDK